MKAAGSLATIQTTQTLKPFGRAASLARLTRSDSDVAYVLHLVADMADTEVALLVRRQRCCAPVAAARQLAMYLVHVMLSRSLTQVGALFGRDRTTVAHACMLIEDRRDDKVFEVQMLALERAIDARIKPEERRHAAA